MSLRSVFILSITLFTFSFGESQEITANYPSGFYTDTLELQFSFDDQYQLRYSTDGHEPDHSSMLYNQGINITKASLDENQISLIPTNPANTSLNYRWLPPQNKILKSRIIFAALFDNENKISETQRFEYFIGEEFNELNLPIISLLTTHEGLLSYENGIYVPGKDYDDNPNVWQPGNYFNRGKDWERIASLSIYENRTQVVHQEIELKIHGGGSRIMPCKSLRLSAKANLGNEWIEYPIFQQRPWQKYKRLILRNAGQDFNFSLLSDLLMQELIKGQNIETQAIQQVVVFLNGAYWGIHNLRERYDKYYFLDYHEEDIEDIDYLEVAMDFLEKEGDITDYIQLNEWLLTHDVSNSDHYQYLANQIDLANYIDHHISEVYGGGNDWTGNNERIWRINSHDGSTPSPWRWIANDYDDNFRNQDKDAFAHALNESGDNWPNPEWSTRLFRALMESKEFAQRYKTRLRYHLDHTFEYNRFCQTLDSLAAIYRPEMPRQIERWNYPTSSDAWENNIQNMKDFAQHRNQIVWEQFNDYFPEIHSDQKMSVRPNPSNGQISIQQGSNLLLIEEYQIYNIQGKLMKQRVIDSTILPDFYQFFVGDLSSGLYFIKFIQGTEPKCLKFMIQH